MIFTVINTLAVTLIKIAAIITWWLMFVQRKKYKLTIYSTKGVTSYNEESVHVC